MQLKFGYDLRPKVWDESGGYPFSYSIWSWDSKKKNRRMCSRWLECYDKDLAPQPSKTEIVSKLSRHLDDDVRTAIIIRNVKTYENLIELLDAYDLNLSSGNNGYGLFKKSEVLS